MNINIKGNFMNHSFKTIKEVLDKYKIINIPYYQREYVWGSNNDGRNLYKFIDDIFTAYKENTSSSYFIGTLAFCSEKVNDVIDGQQRLTSIILILSMLTENYCSNTIRDEFKKILFPFNDEKFVIQEDSYLTEEIKYNLGFKNSFNTQGYKKDISKTLDRIRTQLKTGWSGFTTEWYDGLYAYILNKVNFISLEYTNVGESLKYFLNINSLSIQLTQSDIFYSILSQSLRISKSLYSIFDIKRRISKLGEIRGLSSNIDGYKQYDKDGDKAVDNIIYIFLNSYYQKDKNIDSLNDTGIGKWLSFYRNDVFNDQLIAKDFIDKFLSYLNDFEYILKKFNNFDNTLNTSSSVYMSWILLQYESYYDLLKMLMELFRTRHNYIDSNHNLYKDSSKEIDDNKLEEISKRLNLTLLWNYIRASNKRLDGFITNIALNISGIYKKSIDDIKVDINVDDIFNLNFRDKNNVSNARIPDQSRIIKVIFAFQEAFLDHTAVPSKEFNEFLANLLNTDNFSIEHLYSVNEWKISSRLQKWRQMGLFNADTDFDTARFKFENLSLLDKSSNSQANDDEIYDKLTIYRNAKKICGSYWEYLIQSLVDNSPFYENDNIKKLNLPKRVLVDIDQNTWKLNDNNRAFNEDLMKLVIDYVSSMN